MDSIDILPDIELWPLTELSEKFISTGAKTLKEAAYFLNALEYGRNYVKDDIFAVFSEHKGNCTTKHAVFAALAWEYRVPVFKTVGIYKLTEEIVSGTDAILKKYNLPFFPYIHCFLTYKDFRIDLTEGNCNGKNKTIDNYIYTEKVRYNITDEEENIIYLKILSNILLHDKHFKSLDIYSALMILNDVKSLLSSKSACLL